MMDAILFLVLSAVSLATGQVLEEGDTCGEKNWTCKLFSDCETAFADVEQGKLPELCSFDPYTDERIICCRPDTATRIQPMKPTKRISQRKCEEYSQAAYVNKYVHHKRKFERQLDCGVRTQQLIVGGVDASLKEFPHQAHIGYGNDRNRIRWICGGSLISDKWILSAAHCTNTARGAPKWARLGELDYNSNTDGAEPKIVPISKAINHEGYRHNKQLYNDIALYELAQKIEFTPHIRPLCLQQPDSSNSDKSAVASGWGHTAWAGRSSAKLQKVQLNYVSNARCGEYYAENTAELPNGIIDSQICAGDQDFKDTCQGDSGGPLQRYLDNVQCMYELVGLTSFGSACGSGVPGVYTRISYFVPWIEKIVWPNQ